MGLNVPEIEARVKEADEDAIHGCLFGRQPVSGAEDSRSCARRVSPAAGLGKVGPSPCR